MDFENDEESVVDDGDDLRKDTVGAYYMKIERRENFGEASVFVVELPISEHGRPEVLEAKETEMENLRAYETFEEVEDEGRKTIGSRWVITKKEKHDGQKTLYKARLVARGFQEENKPQSDSPTASRDSFKLMMAVAANEGFELSSIDICAAFLQAKVLDREVLVKPPDDVRKSGIVWWLKKPLYGLDDASRKF